MTAKLLDGRALSLKIKEKVKREVQELGSNDGVPGLAVIMVGGDPASKIYVGGKKRACQEIGIVSSEFILEESITEQELIKIIKKLNHNKNANGILLQLPLPAHINETNVISEIDPLKDVDCFHPNNVGNLSLGIPNFLPCTPAGIIKIIEENGYSIEGKECVVVGRSNMVGKPTAMMLLAKNGTVTVCHSKTNNLIDICKMADILVVAVGKPEIIDQRYIKPGAIVIDVGITRMENQKVIGDVQFDTVSKVAGAITPVPGGIGPMTIAMLMENTLKAFKMQRRIYESRPKC